jgi:CheY-like chemotaxis protein
MLKVVPKVEDFSPQNTVEYYKRLANRTRSGLKRKMDQTSNNRIIVAGGDSNFSYLMQRYARRCAQKIINANLDKDLIETARCQKPVAIILEVDRPKTIGWQLLQDLKVDHETGGIPVIVCSWLEEETLALDQGANAYLRMPILYSDFESTLKSIMLKEPNEKSS